MSEPHGPLFYRPGVIRGRSPHKLEINTEPSLPLSSSNRRALCSLFSNLSLLFEIDETKRVVIEYWG